MQLRLGRQKGPFRILPSLHHSIMRIPHRVIELVFSLAVAFSVTAQEADTLKYSLFPPPTGVQSGAKLGSSLAVDGGYTVAGAPFHDGGAPDSGVVKVFDSATGALLFILTKPGTPEFGDYFGFSVAISGTRVVIGVPYDRAGTPLSGHAYVYDLASTTPTVPVAILTNPAPASNSFFGWAVGISGTRIVVGIPNAAAGGSAVGRACVYDLTSATPTVPLVTLNNPSPASFEYFGQAVAISGTLVLIGTPSDSTGAGDAGSAYVYDVAGATPASPVVTLNNPEPASADSFGRAVSISGTLVVVGTPGKDTGAPESGSAYVYDVAGATPMVPLVTLNNPTPAFGDSFGRAVAISGTHVVAGAAGDDTGANSAGSVYVYDVAGATPTLPVTTLNNPAPAFGDTFGHAVAISGAQVAVGAQQDDAGAEDTGSAYVYDVAGATPTVPVAILNHPGPGLGDEFGHAVAVSGTRLVVGAPYDGTGARNAGTALVYDLSSATPLVPVVTLNNPAPEQSDNFGWSVAICGTRLVVGARRDNTGATFAGSAYVYELAGATPAVPLATLHNPSPAQVDNFGWSVAICEKRVVVGAPYDDTPQSDVGIAYVYDLASPTPTMPAILLNNPMQMLGDHFGWSVAISGTRVVVGSPDDDTGDLNAGRAYVYDVAGVTPAVPIATLNNPTPFYEDKFGYAVGISGTRVIAGAPGDRTLGLGYGGAYVYDVAGVTPNVPLATYLNPFPTASMNFGRSVAISGTRFVVGAYRDDTGGIYPGSAFLYDLAGAAPALPFVSLIRPDPVPADNFGYSVAIDNITVAVGATLVDVTAYNKGAAYVFHAPNLQTLPATAIRTTTAVFNGAVDPRGLETSVRYEWGYKPALENATADLLIGSGTSFVLTPTAMTDLSPDSKVFFRVRAENSEGVNYGATLSFTTQTLLQEWKFAHLGDANAPDSGDPDRDGLKTLVEYGLAFLPEMHSAPPGAEVVDYADGRRLRILLQRDPTHRDVNTVVQAAAAPSGPWATVAISTLGAPFTGPGYFGGDSATPGVKTVEVRDTMDVSEAERRFMRVLVWY